MWTLSFVSNFVCSVVCSVQSVISLNMNNIYASIKLIANFKILLYIFHNVRALKNLHICIQVDYCSSQIYVNLILYSVVDKQNSAWS